MRPRLVGIVWLATVVAFVGGVVLTGDAARDGVASGVTYTVYVLAVTTMGALVARRRPANPIGWILLGAGVAYTVGGITVSHHGSHGSTAVLLEWTSSWVWIVGVAPAVTFGLMLFPDGHLPTPRWRWLGRLAVVATGLIIAGLALQPGRFEGSAYRNPVGLGAAPELPDAFAVLGAGLLVVAVAGSIVSLFARHRRARSVERQQLKWLSYTGALVGLALCAALVIEAVGGDAMVNLSNSIVSLALAAVPVAMAIAILRHRLYDIDVVINRTLVYGSLTAVLTATYLGTVLLLRLVLDPLTGQSDLAVAGSTLAVAALVRPLRSRIQSTVDHRFYRARYDAGRTLVAFSGRLRDEIDLETLGADLSRVVRDTVHPAHVSLWLREAGR